MRSLAVRNRSPLQIVAYSVGSGIAGKGAQFACLIYLAFVLPPSSYGLFAIIQMLVAGVSSIVSASVALATNKSAADLRAKYPAVNSRQILRAVYAHYRWHIGAAAVLNALLVPILFAVISQHEIDVVVVVVACSAVAITVIDALIDAMAGLGSFKKAGLFDGLRSLSSGVAIVALGVSFGYRGAAVGLVVADFLFALVLLGWLAFDRSHALSARLTTPKYHGVVVAGITSNSLAQIGNWVFLWVMQANFGLTGVGTYSVANRFATLVLLIPGFLGKNYLGEISRHEAKGEAVKSAHVVRSYLLAVAGLATAASLVSLVVVPLGFRP